MIRLIIPSVLFGLTIFLILLILITYEDQKARIRVQSRFLKDDSRPERSWRNRLIPYLDLIKLPEPMTRIVDEKTVIWSGIGLTHHQFLALWWLLSLLGLTLGLILIGAGLGEGVGSTLILCTVLCFALFPYLYLKYSIRERQKVVEKLLPDFLDMLTFIVEAGLGLVPALKRVSRGFSGVLGDEMVGALAQIELGFSRRQALEDFADRLPSPDVQQFIEAILLSERLGTSLARTMRIQANLLRTRRRQRAEIKAQTAPIRIIPALVFFFLPSLLLIYLAPPIINFLLRR